MESIAKNTDFDSLTKYIVVSINNMLKNLGISEVWINFFSLVIISVLIILVTAFLSRISTLLITFVFGKIHKKTHLKVLHHAVKNKLPNYLGIIIAYTFLVNIIPLAFTASPNLLGILLKLADIYVTLGVIWTLMAMIHSLANIAQDKPALKNKPIHSYIQIIQIVLNIIAIITIFSVLTGKSVSVFLTAMSAASAILMLMFKDTIMGFVSSIQISANQMVMLGDWITMNKYGADGDVEEINLTTVKIRNFDKTITTIPTYALIADSFQNWRGMYQCGGRRLKRALLIKQSSIRILCDEELARYEQTPALSAYIQKKREVFGELNAKLDITHDSLLKGFQLTNCDLFMAYATWYLRNNPEINQNLTLLVRQLAPIANGLPIEVYAFTSTTAWADYERISSEIINHLIINAKIFDLTIFEALTA